MIFHGHWLYKFFSGTRKDCNNFSRSNITNKDNEPKTGDQLLITAVERMPLQCIYETREMVGKKTLTCFPSTVCNLSTFPSVPLEDR